MSSVRKIRRNSSGVTSLELVMVLAIIAVFAAIAIPGVLGGIQRTGVDGASRRVAEDLRLAQSNALTRGMQARLIAFNQSGIANNPGSADISDSTKRNMYRIEIRNSPAASWPALSATTGTNSNVLTEWHDISQYRGVAITAGNTVIFNTQGFLANSAAALSIVLQGSAGTRTIQTSVIGKATVQ